MTAENPRPTEFRLPHNLVHTYGVLHFLMTPNMQITEVQPPTTEEVTYAVLVRTVIV